ncbi:hypothetical protein Tco_0168380 [Tanacetum coccineum]
MCNVVFKTHDDAAPISAQASLLMQVSLLSSDTHRYSHNNTPYSSLCKAVVCMTLSDFRALIMSIKSCVLHFCLFYVALDPPPSHVLSARYSTCEEKCSYSSGAPPLDIAVPPQSNNSARGESSLVTPTESPNSLRLSRLSHYLCNPIPNRPLPRRDARSHQTYSKPNSDITLCSLAPYSDCVKISLLDEEEFQVTPVALMRYPLGYSHPPPLVPYTLYSGKTYRTLSAASSRGADMMCLLLCAEYKSRGCPPSVDPSGECDVSRELEQIEL